MKRATLSGFLALVAGVGSGCSGDGLSLFNEPPPPKNDIGVAFAPDLGAPPDLTQEAGPPNLCGDVDPRCDEFKLGPSFKKAFPVSTDPGVDPTVDSDGVHRDSDGWLVLDPAPGSSIWLVQESDGTVAKVDPRAMKEVARYRSITCSSRPAGSADSCDGMNGCCAADSQPQWLNRKDAKAEGPAQQVQLMNNRPSSAAVDLNGDVLVANRAYNGQASVTKIAGDPSRCKDRNKNGRIDTSSDVNKDGRIDKNDPKEFLDLDDECILWTTNHGAANSDGQPLALVPGAQPDVPSDAFVGGFYTGTLYRIDGATGRTKDQVQLSPGCAPYRLAVDGQGIGWARSQNPPLCYFDTRKGTSVGRVRGTVAGGGWSDLSLDRDQNVWVASARYTPDRSKGFASLGNGYWTGIDGLAAYALAADSRKRYFVWASNYNVVVRIPASEIPLPRGMDTTVRLDPSWPTLMVSGSAVGMDPDQNVVAIKPPIAVRVNVDANGDFKQPDLTSQPSMGQLCPAGDRCDLGLYGVTGSDFGGFALRNFTRRAPTYSFVVDGCPAGASPTQWYTVTWDAELPPSTSLTVRARSGPTKPPDASWGRWTTDYKVAPIDLSAEGVLLPNGPLEGANYLQLEFTFRSSERNATPKLKSIQVAYKCAGA